MLPRFKTIADWEKAQLLMQPCLIRVIDNLRKQLDNSSYQGTYQEVTEPIPGHQLVLRHSDNTFVLNIWQLCFRVCFVDYQFFSDGEFAIDPNLLDKTGEIDWQGLEDKTQSVIKQIFLELPPISS